MRYIEKNKINDQVIVNSTKNDSATNYLPKDKASLKELICAFFPSVSPQTSVVTSSRFQNDFEKLEDLGRGGFGKVFKARNKFDNRLCAIKRIKLNSKNTQLDQEVKLLSQLDHPNVVRYYCSWIDKLGPEEDLSDDDQNSDISTSQATKDEEDIPTVNDAQFFILATEDQEISSSEDELCDDDLCDDDDISDSSIVFCTNDELGIPNGNVKICDPVRKTKSPNIHFKERSYMYIQMEICEKNTLRTAIDGGLHSDTDKIWRLFRELVEGLVYIHQEGIIHRDLKPENIFVNANDHVKIGDFGLATVNIINRELTDSELFSPVAGESMTRGIGSFFYVAPELIASTRVRRDQKVDMYSLGIILFEMCYGGLNTGMERVDVLKKLRLKEIEYPVEFLSDKYSKPRTIINLLLTHNISARPTSQDLLQSEHMPPPILEERELREVVRHTLNDRQSKDYKFLVESLFNQKQNDDYDVFRSIPTELTERQLQLHEYVKDVVIKIFKLHGGQCLSTPLLMPFSKNYEDGESCVKLMNQAGHVINIPYDLRVPFARYVAGKGITWLKRYSIEKVYRANKFSRDEPRELYQCAFDIVTPTQGTLMGEAELLSILSEILNEFTVLDNKNISIRLNHTSLLKAILLYYIPEEKHDIVYSILSKAYWKKKVTDLITELNESLCLPSNKMKNLLNLLRTETTIKKITKDLRMILKKDGEVGKLAKQGLNELKQIILNTQTLGVKCQIKVALSLIYNRQHYSGMMCQLLYKLRKKKGRLVLAAGGRYDSMLHKYFQISQKTQQGLSTLNSLPSAVGISFLLDKLVMALQDEEGVKKENLSNLDVLVCSEGHKITKPMIKEQGEVLKDLWDAGIRCSIVEIKEAQNLCTKLRVPHLVIVSQPGIVRVKTFRENSWMERSIITTKLVKFIQNPIEFENELICDILLELNNDATTQAIVQSTTPKIHWLFKFNEFGCICTFISQYYIPIIVVIKQLLEPDIQCTLLAHDSLSDDSMKHLSKRLTVPYIQILKDDDNFTVKTWNKNNKLLERKVSNWQLAEFLRNTILIKNRRKTLTLGKGK